MAGMARSRPNPPLIHLIVAMAVIMVPALLAVAWFSRVPAPRVAVVDPAPVVAAARAASGYAVAVPANLPDGWVCTRARWTPQGRPGVGGTPALGNSFALGYLTPAQVYVAIDQRDAAPDALVADLTRKGTRDGDSTVSGRGWERYHSPDGRTRALVLRGADHVTVVSGDLGYEGLEAFAATLSFAAG